MLSRKLEDDMAGEERHARCWLCVCVYLHCFGAVVHDGECERGLLLCVSDVNRAALVQEQLHHLELPFECLVHYHSKKDLIHDLLKSVVTFTSCPHKIRVRYGAVQREPAELVAGRVGVKPGLDNLLHLLDVILLVGLVKLLAQLIHLHLPKHHASSIYSTVASFFSFAKENKRNNNDLNIYL